MHGILRMEEELYYVCGTSMAEMLDIEGAELPFVVREGIYCSTPIETPYYAGNVSSFWPAENTLFYPGNDRQPSHIYFYSCFGNTRSLWNSNVFLPGVTCRFEDICFHCGDPEVWDGELVHELKKKFSVVRPICHQCHSSGKQIITRNGIKVGAKAQGAKKKKC